MSNQKKNLCNAVDEKIKENICEAAKKLFFQTSPQQVTMELVARESGIPRGTLYYYFKNKAKLIAYLITSINKPYEDHVELITNSDMSALDKLLAITESNMVAASEQKRFFALIAEHAAVAFSQSLIQKTALQSQKRDFERITKIIKAGLNEKVFRDIPVEELSMVYFGITATFVRRMAANASQHTPAEDAKTVIDLLVRGVCPPEIQNKIR